MSVVQHAERIAAKFEHYAGTAHRASLLEILTEVLKLEFDPKLTKAERESLEEAIWNQTCARLGISSCCVDEVAALLARCCAQSRKCGCFSASE